MIRHPPRKEPRVLALVPERGRLFFAAVDPWEIRSTGELRPRSGAQVLALRRLIRREKPTILVTDSKRLREALTRAAKVVGVPVLTGPIAHVSASGRDLYPELPLYAPTPPLERVALLAIAALLHLPHVPTRPYAPRRR